MAMLAAALSWCTAVVVFLRITFLGHLNLFAAIAPMVLARSGSFGSKCAGHWLCLLGGLTGGSLVIFRPHGVCVLKVLKLRIA